MNVSPWELKFKLNKIMNVLTSQLPSGGYGYNFSSVQVSPMSFIQITHYLENVPENDPLEKYLYDIKNLLDEDKNIMDCYIMDVDFLIFFKKFITISGDMSFNISIKCPECGKKLAKTIYMNKDIHFKQIDRSIMEGSYIELGGHKYETIVPTVRDFFKVFQRYLKYRTVTDLKMIKTIALIKESDLLGNQVENDVLNAKHSDVTLLLALRDLYYDRLEKIEFFCEDCNKDKTKEERRSVAVSVESLIVDFFREICDNNPIDGSKILFKQVREG